MALGKTTKIFIILGIAVLILIYPIIEINGFFTSSETKEFTVSKGETFSEITEKLKENDIISSTFMFKVYARLFFSNEINKIPAGDFTVRGKLSYGKVMNILINESTHKTVTVTIPEGYEVREIAELLHNKGICDKEKFIDVANNYPFSFKYMDNIKNKENRLEGFLFPDTYTFLKEGTDEVLVIETMLKRFEEIYSEFENIKTDYSVFEIITLASIIEREAKTKTDFYNVSSVFHNRLERNDYLGYLQSCATVQYILKERKSVLTYADTKIDSLYNTYKYPGLPKGPISSPGKLAIDAALNPNKTDYLYFLNDKDGNLYFSKTNSQHEQLKNKYVN